MLSTRATRNFWLLTIAALLTVGTTATAQADEVPPTSGHVEPSQAPLDPEQLLADQAIIPSVTAMRIDEPAKVSGVITAALGIDLSQVVVRLVDTQGNKVAETTADAAGYYQFNGVVPDLYYVQAWSQQFPHTIDLMGTYWGDAVERDYAQVLSVWPGGNVTNVNIKIRRRDYIHIADYPYWTMDGSFCIIAYGLDVNAVSSGCITNTQMAEVTVPGGFYLIAAYKRSASGAVTDYRYWSQSSSAGVTLRSAASPLLSQAIEIMTLGSTPPPRGELTVMDMRSVPFLGLTPATVTVGNGSFIGPLTRGVPGVASVQVSGAGPVPTGLVDFFDEGGYLGTATLSGGQATLAFTPDTYDESITVEYRGDSTYNWGVSNETPITYTPTIDAVYPGWVRVGETTPAALVGTGLDTLTSVSVGGAPATNVAPYDEKWADVTIPALSSPGTYDVHGIANSRGLRRSGGAIVTAIRPAEYVHTNTPSRVLDLANLKPETISCFPVGGTQAAPLGASAVIVNVTASGASGPGNVVIYPDEGGIHFTPPPSSSTVNFEAGQDVANSAVVRLPADGYLCAYSQASPLSRLIIDVSGFIVDGSGITTQTSQRLVDTRYGLGGVPAHVTPGSTKTVQVTGNAGVPAGATSILANVTVTNVTGVGHLRAWAAGQAMPSTSVINYAPGQDKANAQIIALSPDGKLSFESFTGGAAVDVIIDVVGYTEPGSVFTATSPTRIVETRAANGIVGPISGGLQASAAYSVPVPQDVVPANATSVILNVTAVGPSGPGHLRVYPDTSGNGHTSPPDTSTINYVPGRDIPNLVIVALPADRAINFYNVQGAGNSTNLVVDVVGYTRDLTP